MLSLQPFLIYFRRCYWLHMKISQFLKQQTHLQNLSIYGIGQLFNLVTPLLIIPYLISVCGIANYGKASLGMAVVFFLIVFIDYGSDILGVKAVATNRENAPELQRLFSVIYTSKFFVLLVVMSLMAIVVLVIPYFGDEKALFLLCLPILIGQFLNPSWFLQGIENFKQITILNIISKTVYVIGILFFIKTESDYIFINLWWGIGMIVANGISLFFLMRSQKLQFQKIRKEAIVENLRSGFSLFSSQIFVSIQLYSPLILIGLIGNPAMAGMYRVVDQVIVIFKTYLLLFFNFAFPRVCFLLQKDRLEGLHFWKLYNGVNFIFITVSMAIVYYFADPIITYFHPEDTVYITKLLQVAVLIPLLFSISLPLKQLVLGFSLENFYIRTTVILVLIMVVLIVVLVPIFEIYGALLSIIAIEVVAAIVYFYKIKNRIFYR